MIYYLLPSFPYMPHLSPLFWLATPLIIFSILLTLTLTLWWNQSYIIPPKFTKPSSSNHFSSWTWK